ncbi:MULTISPECIES: hypothetical protein [Veillonella]|jgi:hypothetical protein|uniref:Uncharacterized protein n=1 Tax=Veillonella rodentium TaxID=248315 RepID=A0A239Y7W0_9FIRM|nr:MULTISPECIES: hypothetical protein [Veillonella]SNV54750.1 Uncharacterised protein [Veillonella rodentium]VTY46897.1 Uncharacterised protein [Veillonella parvula]
MKKFVSDICNKKIKGHSNYDFADVAVNSDNLLFIDPVLIETKKNKWCKEAKEIITSFFDELYKAYKENNRKRKKELLLHAREQNATHLGYGSGSNGKGNTAEGLLNLFKPLEKLITKIPTIEKDVDLVVLLPGFAEDGLSDLLTNILHKHLNDYTLEQMKKYGMNSIETKKFWSWNQEKAYWEELEKPVCCVDGRELLLVPKCILRKNYLFGTGQYFSRIIIERIREEGGYMIDGKPIPKKEIIKSKRHSGKYWQYNEVTSYTQKNNDALDEYHKELPNYYSEKYSRLSDSQLDEIIYRE